MLKSDRNGHEKDEGWAEALGIRALEYLAEEPALLGRFLAMSGLEPGQLRQAATQPAFFAGLLDFILAHEPTLIAFAAAANVRPEQVAEARRALAGSYGETPQ